MRQPRRLSSAHAKRLEELAAALDAYRGIEPGRRLSCALRARVVAAIDAGVTVRAVSEACKVSKDPEGVYFTTSRPKLASA